MCFFWKRLLKLVGLLTVLGVALRFRATSRAEDFPYYDVVLFAFRTTEEVALAGSSPLRAIPPSGFLANRVTLRPEPPGLRAHSPEAREDLILPEVYPALGRKTAAASGSRAQNRKRPPGFRTSGTGLADDATREVQESRALAQQVPPANGASTTPETMPPRGDLPTAPAVPVVPGEGLLLVPEMPPPSRKPRFRVEGTPPEAEVEMEGEEETEKLPEEEPLHSIAPWPAVESPVFGTEEVTEFSQQVVSAGRWSLRPYVSLGVNYDGNVFISDADSQKDIIVRVAPGLLFRLGNELTPLLILADYRVNAAFYLNHSSDDAFDQTGRLDLSWRLAKLTLGLRLGVDSMTTTSIDASGRVDRTSFYAGVVSRYEFNEKFSLELGSDYRFTRVKGLIGATEGRVNAYLDYHFSPKLSIGAGGGIGVDEAEYASKQNLQLLALRGTFATTAKLTLTANAGVEFRQFEDGADEIKPVYGLDVAWAAREGTNVTFGARQRILNSSVFSDQNYTSTAVFLSIQQRMTDRFDLFFTAGYENLVYSSAGSGVTADRVDHAWLLRAGIQWHALAWLNAGLYYEYSQDASTGAGNRSFVRDRVGTQINLLF